ncbi:5-oxoprolinase subunit C family protein [Pseudomonas sp. ZS1P83]
MRQIRLIYGPHGAPEYVTENYIGTFFATQWEVHFNSSRTGVRLIGPKPEWVRAFGGEAGLHPSNILTIRTPLVQWISPVILGPEGPSLGGFVCPVTVIEADLWQLGQLKAGDKVQFLPVDLKTARNLVLKWDTPCGSGFAREKAASVDIDVSDTPLSRPEPFRQHGFAVSGSLVARLSGDTHLLLEIGAPELDLVLRFRAHALMQALESQNLHGVIDLTPAGGPPFRPGMVRVLESTHQVLKGVKIGPLSPRPAGAV